MDTNWMFELYNKAFPKLRTDLLTFSRRLKLDEGAVVLECEEDGTLVGYSVVYDGSVLLLVVDEEYRRRGIGSRLLMQSEELIGGTVTLGASGGAYLLCGVPTEGDGVPFFEKRGYEKDWISCDMVIDLRRYKRITQLDNSDESVVIRRRNSSESDILSASECGDEIDGWGEVFGSAPYMLVAEKDGRIIGGVMVDTQDCLFPVSMPNCGSFGCLGVLEEFRDRGIGMKLCQAAVCAIRDSGRIWCHIGYTWLDWWYEKIGSVKYMSYWIGKKRTN